jgi:cell division protease FtsH
VRAIVERNYLRARTLLMENMDRLHAMAAALIRYETLTATEIQRIMAGLPVERPDDDPGTTGGVAATTAADRPEVGPRNANRPAVGIPVGQH